MLNAGGPFSWILKLSGRPVSHSAESPVLGDTGGQGEGSPEFRELLTPKMAACKGVAPPCVDNFRMMWCRGCSSEPKQKVDLRLDTGCGTGCDRAGQLVCGVVAKLQQFISSLFALAEFLR